MGLNMNVSIIGCGYIGQKRAKFLQNNKLTVACDIDFNKAKKLASQFPDCIATDGIDSSINSSDVVLISTINSKLAPIALSAINGGKHVLIEKPGAINMLELDKIEEAIRNTKSLVRIGYNHRYHPAFLKMLEIFNSGELGPIMFLRGRYGHGGRIGYDKEWRADVSICGGGELIDQGVHLIDLAGIFLREFKTIEGYVDTYFWNMDVEDNVFLNLRNSNNNTAWLHASCTEWKNMFSFEVYGEYGKLHWEGLGGSYGTEKLTYYKMLPEMGPPETITYEFPREDQSWKIEMEEFFTDISLNRTPVPGIREAKLAMSVVEKIYRSK